MKDKNEPDFFLVLAKLLFYEQNNSCGGAAKQGVYLLSMTKQPKCDLCQGFIQTTEENVVGPDLQLLWPHDTDQVSVLPAGIPS